MAYMNYDACVLFSSGIDSLACLQWAIKHYKNILALYVNTGVPYTVHELRAVGGIVDSIMGLDYKIVDMPLLGAVTAETGHTPFRNIFFLEMAALYSRNVVFGMLYGEYSEDKSPAFIKRMQSLFDSQTKKNLYNTGEHIRIHTPFSKMTKTQVVKYLLDEGYKGTDFTNTVGCLQSRECGQCMSCFNRWVAFENNGLYNIDDYEYNHPAKWGQENLKLRSNVLKQAANHVPLWSKRRWLWDVYKAYKSAEKRQLI